MAGWQKIRRLKCKHCTFESTNPFEICLCEEKTCKNKKVFAKHQKRGILAKLKMAFPTRKTFHSTKTFGVLSQDSAKVGAIWEVKETFAKVLKIVSDVILWRREEIYRLFKAEKAL